MVGTKPTLMPLWRARRERPRSSDPRVTIRTSLRFARLVRGLLRRRGVALRLGGIAPGADVLPERRDGAPDRVSGLGVPPHEARRLAEAEADQVVEHEHLPVAVESRADADRGNLDRGGDLAPQLERDALQNDRETARPLQRQGVVEEHVRGAP